MRRLLLVILVVLIASCSPPSFVAQRYTNFTAYYNTFHNAEDAFQAGIESLESSNAPIDRSRFLPVFVPPDRVGGGQEFGRAIRKSADILRNHPNSKWVDDALLLIGKSYFYQQNYVGAAQKFREAIALESQLEGEARFWLARALIGAGNDQAAAEHFRSSLDEGGAYGRWTDMMQLARGELLARQEQWAAAAAALEGGLAGDPDDRPAARAAFLLGQVQEQVGAHEAAVRAFERVNEDYQPRYELAFAARISALRVAGVHGDTEDALRRLQRMERDDKNFEKRAELTLLRGQLYRAMGRSREAQETFRALLYDEDQQAARAIRGQVHYALGTLYQKAYDDFSAAAAHYDTAATALGSSMATSADAMAQAPAAIIDSQTRADLYRTLSDKAAQVSRADSLLQLGALSDSAFAEAVAALRARRAEEEAQRRRTAERREARQQFTGSQPRLQRQTTSQQRADAGARADAGFLFHRSPVQVQEAQRNFERRWGQRPLVPNWRRLEAISGQGAAQDTEDVAAPTAEAGGVSDGARRTPLVDVSAVPRDSASRAQMEARRAVARYEFANALFLAASRPDSAAYWYRRVAEEDAGQPVARRALYALAEAHQSRGDTAGAQQVYRRIIEAYPRSPFALRARQQLGQEDPSPVPADSLAQAQDAYERAYTTWQAGGTEAALRQFVDAAVAHADTPVAPKALWAGLTVFLEEASDQAPRLQMPLPPVFGRVLGGSDTTAALQASRVMGVGGPASALPTLGAVLDHMMTRYPDAPHTQRAERLRSVLEAQEAPAPDSLTADSAAVAAAPDSAMADSAMADSAASDALADAPVPDSVAADTARTDSARRPALAPQPPPDTAQAGGSRTRTWTIVLGTRESRSVASNLQRVYQARFEPEGLSVRIREVPAGEAVQYQITAGVFSNEQDATATMQRLRMQVPGSARVERIQ